MSSETPETQTVSTEPVSTESVSAETKLPPFDWSTARAKALSALETGQVQRGPSKNVFVDRTDDREEENDGSNGDSDGCDDREEVSDHEVSDSADECSQHTQCCEPDCCEPSVVLSTEDYIVQQATAVVPTSYKSLLKYSFDDFKGKPVTVIGWARSVRKLQRGELLFLQLYDGTCKEDLQVIVEKSHVSPKDFEHASRGKTRWCFEVCGHIKISPGAEQPWELVADTVTVLGESADEYPLQKRGKNSQGPSIDKLRFLPHLRVQNYVFAAIARLRHCLAMAVHAFYGKLGFYWVAAPIITMSDCEGAGEAFRVISEKELTERESRQQMKGAMQKALHIASQPTVKVGKELIETWEKQLAETNTPLSTEFFKTAAYLTVSGQLEGEAYAMALKKVYTFGPTFRAEESLTSRHLAEFWMIEPEVVGITKDQLMTLGETFVKFTIQRALDECSSEIELLSETFGGLTSLEKLQNIVKSDFVRLSYTDAIEVLKKHAPEAKFEQQPEWGIDLGSEHERYLTDHVYKLPVILHDYPAAIKAFYMKPSPGCAEDRKTVQACDWLVPGIGELIGGSVREESLERLTEAMTARGMDLAPYQSYLDLRRYGTAPHGGFGLGFERLIAFVGGVPTVKDVIPMPRWFGHHPGALCDEK